MKILITTGLTEKDIGGPFQYGPRLRNEFQKIGYDVKLASYGSVEKLLPIGFRHIYFFLKVYPKILWADYILTLDTFSVGLPTVLASSLLNKKVIVRVGGDFLWSAYVNRTEMSETLTAFYKCLPRLNLKEKIILYFTKVLVKRANFLAFNTEWQKDLWREYYKLENSRIKVVRNFLPEKMIPEESKIKNFLWAGRLIPEKNIELLKRVSERLSRKHLDVRIDIVSGESHHAVLDRIRNSYALVSLAFSDICPNFILEGVSYGKPFVMTRETGLMEIYPRGGLFVDSLDEGEVEKGLETMLDTNVYNGFVEELKKMDKRHAWQDLAEEYLDIWKRA